jgi:hypothetical protein
MAALTPGEIANVDLDGRIKIPSDVLKVVVWWTGKTVRVSVELTYKGLVRVYPSSAVRKRLEVDDIEEVTSEAVFVARAVRADRYRDASLYGDPDCRLRLTKDICPWLGFALGDRAPLYVQAFPNGLEIMTIEHRFDRLTAAQADVLPWTFQALD